MKEYNTAINPLGSISDIQIIVETIKRYNNSDDLKEVRDEFIDGNAFGFDITSSRKRFFTVIKKLFLQPKNKNEKSHQFFLEIISKPISTNTKKIILYLETNRQNDLIRDINIQLIPKKYKENRRIITSSEVFDFLTEIKDGTKMDDWSESTLKTCSYKYITFMKSLGFFEKENRIKSIFSFPYPDEKIITYLVYLLKYSNKTDEEIYNSCLFKALLLSDSEKLELIKKAAIKSYFDFSFAGNGVASFSLSLKRGEIIDELFN